MKEAKEQIFEDGAQAQYECWNPEGDGDVEKFTKLKDKAVKKVLELMQSYAEEQVKKALENNKINRVEVIDDKGRSYVNWKESNKVTLSLQDEDRTLKIFIE